MGKTVYFLDSVLQQDGTYNVTYSASDVNKIVQNLVGSGISPLVSHSQYTTSYLNSLTGAVVASGASINGLKASFSDNQIIINQGIGYFDNGATIVVDSSGVTVSYTPASKNYVYALFDESLNTCDFYSSTVSPSANTGQYILNIAEIAADGTVTDTRTFARAKIGTLGRNVTYDVTANLDSIYVHNEDVLYETDFDISKFNGVLVDYQRYRDTDGIKGFFDFSVSESIRVALLSSHNYSDMHIIASKVNSKIRIHAECFDSHSYTCCGLFLKFF